MSRDLELVDGGDPVRHQAAAWFARLCADDVSEADRRQWQAWIDADPRHRAGYERFERLWSTLGAHAQAPDIAAGLDAIGPGASAPPVPRRRAGWVGAFAMAASIAAAVLVGWWLWPVAGDASGAEYATSVGEQRRLTLEDGTRVTLDTDTRLRVAYSGDARRLVLERGRAFFEVAREPRPLSVHTSHGSVRAVGTEFEVFRQPHATDVALVEGKVVLSGTDAAGVEVPMRAGQRASMGEGMASPWIETPRTLLTPPWLSGRLVFEDASLDDVAAAFNRYSHQQIVLADARLSTIHISGVFRSDGMQAFIAALRDAYPVEVDTSQPGIVRLQHAG